MNIELVEDDGNLGKNKWSDLISALKDLPKGKAIKLKSEDTSKDVNSIRQAIYQEIGSGKFSVLQGDNEIFIKYMN